MRRIRLLVVVVGALVALWSGAGVSLASGAAAPDGRDGPSENDFVARVNAARAAVGLGSLTVRADLVDVARRHSTDMATQQRLYHNPSLATDVSGWQRVGENVGVGPDVASVHDAFMRSQVHREDILSPYWTEMGIGVVWDGSTMWVTQVFRQPTSSSSASSSSSSSSSSSAPAARAPSPSPSPAATRAPHAAPVRPSAPPPTSPPTAPPTVPVTTPPTTAAPVAPVARVADVLGVAREQAIAVPSSVPRIPVPVGIAAALLALVTAAQGVAVRRLGLA